MTPGEQANTEREHRKLGIACSLCPHLGADAQAVHKVGEEETVGPSGRKPWHNFTNYLCCDCFGLVMGVVAMEDCHRD